MTDDKQNDLNAVAETGGAGSFYLDDGAGPALPPDLPEEFFAGAARTSDETAAETHAIEGALREVFDPEIPVNIFDLGLVYEINAADAGTEIVMTLTAPACPVAGTLPQQVADAAAKVPGAGRVSVKMTWEPPWDWSRMSDEARAALGFID
ncbi:MAG: iron-sulfur cluster assembly protein [Alphaproteobacteria bacterium]|nr:iron-sulfur cluster assembly protein [Alphaproteobacteria bacterium]MDA7987118.1 iron-sulfur cluster assembly protein [Alphaproteobacteria bacterium]MDA8000249.1 iron-sulfur cluster assembly protein [Alphaproteobacteria bacterium]MDA8003506.1 iron-sulfur cluster assembly protein [Alphaproteobacteria bacterium]MDA8005511.1 iron-sulfur cluster assembly protein [Alphaproteobacteria bacterium]